MMSNTMKIVSATAIAAALLATVSVARTVHIHGAAPAAATVGLLPEAAQPRPHANFACAPSLRADCDKLDWFPE